LNLKNYPNLVEKNLKYSYTVFNTKSKAMKADSKRSFGERLRERQRKFKTI